MEEVSVVPDATLLLTRRVQEMVSDGVEPPPPYISRNKDDPKENVLFSEASIPIVDLGILSNSKEVFEETIYEEELQKLKSALSSWGCFQGIGHGIPGLFLDKLQNMSREFFKQPMEEKKKYAKEVEEFEGYGSDPTPELGQSLDWSDRIYLTVSPQDQIVPRFWPQNPPSFREILSEYTEKIKMIIEFTSKAMAKSLNLDENCFLSQFGQKPVLAARLNYYSKCPRPDLILGLKPHADGSGYTMILQDEVGLQILNNDKWFTVPKVPNAILFLMGDQMEIMSNGIFKSPVHRVLSSLESDRISIAMFYVPENGKEIGPEEELINDENPRLFKKVKDYVPLHLGFYQRGLRALHTAAS